MRKIRQALQMAGELGLNKTVIAARLHVNRNTVYDYLLRASAAKLTWPLPPKLRSNKALERLLYPRPPAARHFSKPQPNWADVHRAVTINGLQVRDTHQQYLSEHGSGMAYSGFCTLYRKWRDSNQHNANGKLSKDQQQLGQHEKYLSQLSKQLEKEGYSIKSQLFYLRATRIFLAHLRTQQQSANSVTQEFVDAYADSLQYRYKGGLLPFKYRRDQRAYIYRLMTIIRGTWPPKKAFQSPQDRFCDQLINAYDGYLDKERALSAATRRHRRQASSCLLKWLNAERNTKELSMISMADIDDHIGFRRKTAGRVAIATIVGSLRCFFRYLYQTKRIPRDLSHLINAPRLYKYENIPAAFQPDVIQSLLQVTRADHSALGKRDFAILTLLATYGLRAGEVTSLRLQDIHWQDQELHIHHSKTNQHTELPLLDHVGDAVLDYLQHGRPQTSADEVFIRSLAPYRPLSGACALHHIIVRRLKDAKLTVKGKRGAHAFRHARAQRMLNANTSIKLIGDVLGHRHISSTMAYLKIGTDQLRKVGLDIPKGVSP